MKFRSINVTTNKYFEHQLFQQLKNNFKIFMNEKVKTIKLNGNGKVVKIITDKNEHELIILFCQVVLLVHVNFT